MILPTFLFLFFFSFCHLFQTSIPDSKWLSFSRQLNNYGFITQNDDNVDDGDVGAFKCYHHSNFYQGIADPMTLEALLPYLPTKRKTAATATATATATAIATTTAATTKRSSRSSKNKRSKKNSTVTVTTKNKTATAKTKMKKIPVVTPTTAVSTVTTDTIAAAVAVAATTTTATSNIINVSLKVVSSSSSSSTSQQQTRITGVEEDCDDSTDSTDSNTGPTKKQKRHTCSRSSSDNRIQQTNYKPSISSPSLSYLSQNPPPKVIIGSSSSSNNNTVPKKQTTKTSQQQQQEKKKEDEWDTPEDMSKIGGAISSSTTCGEVEIVVGRRTANIDGDVQEEKVTEVHGNSNGLLANASLSLSSSLSKSTSAISSAPSSAISSAPSSAPQLEQEDTFKKFFQTPSPQRRSQNASLWSSPPRLHNHNHNYHHHHLNHYHYQHQHQQQQQQQDIATVSENPSVQLSSSLLTVNMLENSPEIKPTPRISNVSSSALSSSASSSSSSSLLLSSPFKKKKHNGSSSDGVKMLSWAAKAVESPLYNGDKKRSRVLCLLAEAIDHSPIIPPPRAPQGSTTRPGFATTMCTAPTATSLMETFDSCVAPANVFITNNNTGSTPIFDDRYHQHTEVDLELLRECLENVFSDSSSNSLSLKPRDNSREDGNYDQSHQTTATW